MYSVLSISIPTVLCHLPPKYVLLMLTVNTKEILFLFFELQWFSGSLNQHHSLRIPLFVLCAAHLSMDRMQSESCQLRDSSFPAHPPSHQRCLDLTENNFSALAALSGLLVSPSNIFTLKSLKIHEQEALTLHLCLEHHIIKYVLNGNELWRACPRVWITLNWVSGLYTDKTNKAILVFRGQKNLYKRPCHTHIQVTVPTTNSHITSTCPPEKPPHLSDSSLNIP